ncbi:MAG: hypothetical protein SVM80_12285 [Halobacteriota archaeon]|nr:hypothetical protein [Halobacteriota archaeon]
MNWSFASPEYYFKSGRSAVEQTAIKNLIKTGINNRDSAHEIARTLQRFGVSYRRKNMLDDISRAMASEYSQSAGAYGRSQEFYNRSEKLRKIRKVDRGTAAREMRQIQDREVKLSKKALEKLGDDWGDPDSWYDYEDEVGDWEEEYWG